MRRAMGWGAAVLLCAAFALWWWRAGPGGETSGLQVALTGRGAVAWARSQLPWDALRTVSGLRLDVVEPGAPVSRALFGDQTPALLAALSAAGQETLAVDAGTAGRWPPGSLGARLSAYEYIEGLRGLYLTPDAAVYGIDPLRSLAPALRSALATVARGMLAGKRAPRVESFPAPLRRVQPVEVMVMLRAGPRPRLWRSARGTSLAQALLTATRVARTRWAERARAMGEPLSEALPKLTVDVSLLQDDGRFDDLQPAFLERIFTPAHGVAFERKGAWRYLLPEATRQAGQGHALQAYHALLSDEGLGPDALREPDLRPYRLVVNVLASSAPPPDPDGADGLGAVTDPDELLAP